MREGLSNNELFELSKIDPWFLFQFREIYNMELSINRSMLKNEEHLRKAKTFGFSDVMIAKIIGINEEEVYSARKALKVDFNYNEVDTCAAEFEALTPYLYSSTNITKLPIAKKEENKDKSINNWGRAK